MSYARDRLKINGWGWIGKTFDLEGRDDQLLEFLAESFGVEGFADSPAVDWSDIEVPEPRLQRSGCEALLSLLGADRVKLDAYERIFHALGKSYHDLLRVRAGALPDVPDAVLYPETESEIEAIFALACERHWAIVPFGGGSSVVGGVEAKRGVEHQAIVCVDVTRMCKVISIDAHAGVATAEAGIYGPELERQLQEAGVTLGHYPQSFEFSTLGGWVAARGSGQQSNRYGSAEKWTIGARMVTPTGILEQKAFPHSSSGPDLKHLVLGSEGLFGIITQVTFRVHPVPEHRDYRAYLLPSFEKGAEAIRRTVQAGVKTAMLRLSDEDETYFFGKFKSLGKEQGLGKKLMKMGLSATGLPERPCVLMAGFEGQPDEVRKARAQARSFIREQGGIPVGSGPGDKWYEGRFEMPYLRDPLMDRGVGVDTLETATGWSQLPELYAAVRSAITDAITQESDLRPLLLTHISHSYPDGASLYFTFTFPMDHGAELEQWRRIKRAASDAIRDHGGTISHHHGVGADHVPWMSPEKSEAGLRLLRGAKDAVDPDRIMNPGKVLPEP